MDDLTPVEPRTKEPFEMDDQSFVSNDTYQTDPDTGSQSKLIEKSASGRWQTTNTTNKMESERHLSADSVSRNLRASSDSILRDKDSDRQDVAGTILTQSEGQSYEDKLNPHRVLDSREHDESGTPVLGQSPRQSFGDDGDYSISEGRSDSSEKLQSGNMVSIPSLDPSLIGPRASRGSDHPYGDSKPQEPANSVPATNANEKREMIHTNSSTDQLRGASERLEPEHHVSSSEIELRGRSLSPRPKISAETQARWAMLKQLAGVSQPHNVEDTDLNRRSDEERRTKEAEIRVEEGASIRDSTQTDNSADDASIERYLQKLQRDPHFDSRGLQEGLSRMRSHKSPNRRQDHNSAHGNRFEGDMHSRAQGLGDDTQISEVENAMHKLNQDARDTLQKSEGRAEQALRGREAALTTDEHALEATFEPAGHRTQEELRSATRDARSQLQKDKQGFERDARKDTSIADTAIDMLGSQTAREFRRAEHGLDAGLQRAANAAQSLFPHANGGQDLRRGEHNLVEGFHRAENAFSRTRLDSEILRGECDLMGEVHKLEHEFPHHRLEQEIRKDEDDLVGDVRRVENDLANTKFGQEVRKGEHHLRDEFHKLEHDLSHLGLGQDLGRGEHDLKQGLHEAADHLRKDKQALGRGAETAGRSAKVGLEHTGRFAVEGTAIAGRLGRMALDHAGSGNNASSPRTDVRQPSHGNVDPISHQTPSKPHQADAELPRPTEAPGLHPATKDRRSSPLPARDQQRPPTVEPPRHPQAPQASHHGDSRGLTSGQQPHLSPLPSPARNPPSGPATSKSPLGRMPSPSTGNNQKSQAPVRKPVMPSRPQGYPKQKPPTAMPPHSQPQHPQGVPQHPPQPQHPQGAPQHPPQPQHPQGAPQHPPQPQHFQDAQSHPSHAPSSHSQPSHPEGIPQSPMSQHPPPPQHAMKSLQHALNPMLQHPQASHPPRGPQKTQIPNTTPQQLQAPHLQAGSRQNQSQKAIPQQLQYPHSKGSPQQRQPTSVKPQQPQQLQPPHLTEASQQGQLQSTKPQQPQTPHLQGAPEQRSQTHIPSDAQPPHIQPPLQQRSQGPTPPSPQVSHSQATPQQRSAKTTRRALPQQLHGTAQPMHLREPSEREAQQLEATPNSNAQQAKPAITGATAELDPARNQPLSGDISNFEGKMDEEEPRASVMQEGRRVAVESRRQVAQCQERQSAKDDGHEDHAAESSPHQTERHSTMERAAESRVVSGPQSMLNMFKARADAAVEASGDCPSFTDQIIQLLCNMTQDAMPEIERRLAQNQRQDCS